jgi:hypothetical protein
LKDNEVDEETSEFGQFFRYEVGYLGCVFCQSPYIGERTENQVNDEIDEEVEKVSTLDTNDGIYLLTLDNSASALEMNPCIELNQSKINGASPLNIVYKNVGRNPWTSTATRLFELKKCATAGRTLAR